MAGRLFIRAFDPPRFHAFVASVAPDLRDTLRLCLPAVFVAIILRAAILWFMPAAFVHNDTASIVETADTLVSRGVLSIEGKKTFLVPLVYSVPALIGIPILPFAAVVQHLLGIGSVFLSGFLARLWFRQWRMLIVSLTLFMALQPVLLWYEHAALTESWAVFGVLFVGVAATAFWKTPNRYTLAILFSALFFIAGARPEGRLFALFALALVARTLWGKWPIFRIAVPATGMWTIFLFLITRTGQSGLLLFTSVLHLTPQQLFFSPGIAEAVAPLAEDARRQWNDETQAPKLVPLRKALRERLIEMQTSEGIEPRHAADRADSLSGRAGIETAVRSPWSLPDLALRKFVIAHREPPAPPFNAYAQNDQFLALFDGDPALKALGYSSILWGREIRTSAEARAFLSETYRSFPGDAPSRLQEVWVRMSLLRALPWNLPGARIEDVPIRGIPWLYLAAFLGMLAMALRDPVPLNFHQLWGAFLLALFLLIMVTANIRARFRVIFEPFWLLYAFALLDTVMIFAARLLTRPRNS